MPKSERLQNSAPASSKGRQERLGQQLRKIYDDVVNEPVPDDFLKLLEAADADASEGKSDGEGAS